LSSDEEFTFDEDFDGEVIDTQYDEEIPDVPTAE
jgi:hypothetical protein